jgi:hypothetical protein
MGVLFYLKKILKNKKKEDMATSSVISPALTLKEWIIANNRSVLDKKYRRLLISQLYVDQPFKKYHLKPKE